jgi:phage terminase small subunit
MAKLPDNPYSLSPKRWRFVQEYLRDLNATQAAIRAGYSAKRSDQQGYELLSNPEVKAVVDKEKDRIAEELECTRGDIMMELQAVAFANLSDFGEWLEDGTFLVKCMGDIPRHLLGAIQKVENLKSYDREGSLLKEQVKLHLHPKMDALKTLANIKKIDNIQPPVVVDNRQVNVRQVIDQYSEALDDVAETLRVIPPKRAEEEPDDTGPAVGDT